ncbi:MAG: hypothetical protein PQJ49_14150 [Sphaerochaetaceae bacterium]|nr:hypothetical protein [Sphaerochaetaceae bacterium]
MNSFVSFFSNLSFGKKVLLLATPILSVLISMKAAIFGLWILIFIDLLTGIRKNFHSKGIKFNIFKKIFWKSIKSYLLRQTWKKTYEYGIGILVIVIFETLIFNVPPFTILGGTVRISELAIILPGAVEVWSIYENLEAVSGTNMLKMFKKFLPANIAAVFNSSKVSELHKVDEDLARETEVVEPEEVNEEELLEP